MTHYIQKNKYLHDYGLFIKNYRNQMTVKIFEELKEGKKEERVFDVYQAR